MKGYAQHEQQVFKRHRRSAIEAAGGAIAGRNHRGGEPADERARTPARGRRELPAAQGERTVQPSDGRAVRHRKPHRGRAHALQRSDPGIQHLPPAVPGEHHGRRSSGSRSIRSSKRRPKRSRYRKSPSRSPDARAITAALGTNPLEGASVRDARRDLRADRPARVRVARWTRHRDRPAGHRRRRALTIAARPALRYVDGHRARARQPAHPGVVAPHPARRAARRAGRVARRGSAGLARRRRRAGRPRVGARGRPACARDGCCRGCGRRRRVRGDGRTPVVVAGACRLSRRTTRFHRAV